MLCIGFQIVFFDGESVDRTGENCKMVETIGCEHEKQTARLIENRIELRWCLSNGSSPKTFLDFVCFVNMFTA